MSKIVAFCLQSLFLKTNYATIRVHACVHYPIAAKTNSFEIYMMNTNKIEIAQQSKYFFQYTFFEL